MLQEQGAAYTVLSDRLAGMDLLRVLDLDGNGLIDPIVLMRSLSAFDNGVFTNDVLDQTALAMKSMSNNEGLVSIRTLAGRLGVAMPPTTDLNVEGTAEVGLAEREEAAKKAAEEKEKARKAADEAAKNAAEDEIARKETDRLLRESQDAGKKAAEDELARKTAEEGAKKAAGDEIARKTAEEAAKKAAGDEIARKEEAIKKAAKDEIVRKAPVPDQVWPPSQPSYRSMADSMESTPTDATNWSIAEHLVDEVKADGGGEGCRQCSPTHSKPAGSI